MGLFNDRKLGDVRVRSFITTQSIKMLPSDLEEYALDSTGWHLVGEEGRNQNDPNRFIAVDAITEEGEVCTKKSPI